MLKWSILAMLLLVACANNNRIPNANSAGEAWTDWYEKGTEVEALYVLRNIRVNLLDNQLHDPYVNYGPLSDLTCDKNAHLYRTADGTCNNLASPMVGASGVAFGRNIPPAYITNESKEEMMSPSPRVVSETFFTREGPGDEYKKVPFLNMLAASWIQFMNHDWFTHGKNEPSNPHKLKSPGKPDLALERTQIDPDQGSDKYKSEYQKTTINEVSHWWDASQVYGSNLKQQKKLRTRVTTNSKSDLIKLGKMRLENGLLPMIKDFNPGRNIQNQGKELTGFHDNWWIGLSMLHTLFVKEHNLIVENLVEKYVVWDKKKEMWRWKSEREAKGRTFGNSFGKKTFYNNSALDERLFQLARLINAAVIAKIHTVEWTPAILKNKTLKRAMLTNWYGLGNPRAWSERDAKFFPDKAAWFKLNLGYTLGGIIGSKTNDHGVPFSITEEFTSVYRLHSLLPENLHLKKLNMNGNKIIGEKEEKKIDFNDTRNELAYNLMQDYSMTELFYSFGKQLPGQLVINNFPRFMQNLEIPGLGKMDLGAVDILRDRERGVPRYNQFRQAIGLKAITEYRDLYPRNKELTDKHVDLIEKFKKVYGTTVNSNGVEVDNVDKIDLLVGTLAEEIRPAGFGFGETPFQIFILMASRRLMADRFFTENYNKETYTKLGLDWIDSEGYFDKVILRHMPELKEMIALTEDSAFEPWNEK